MNDPRERQTSFNAASRNQWDAFTAHRRRVSALVGAGTAARATRLCVLGAGNGNDLDLPVLLAAHREVHLVDLDPEALAEGAARQGVAEHRTLRMLGGVDLTGMLDAFARWSPLSAIEPADLAALVERPSSRVAPILAGPYDLVASTCLLSQIAGNAFHAVGDRHPRFRALVEAIRLGHLRLLTELTAPGGEVILVTDVVSTDTLPEVATLAEAELPGLLSWLAREGNVINGVNPAEIVSVLRRDPVLSRRVAGLQALSPWRWNLHARVYLVWGLRIERGGPGSS
jgi:hypothetical protein